MTNLKTDEIMILLRWYSSRIETMQVKYEDKVVHDKLLELLYKMQKE